jgi:hypothetical protein
MARSREPRRGQAWRVLLQHHGSRRAFLTVYRDYEERVNRLVEERHIAREKLRLTPGETEALFDTASLRALIEDNVVPLREACHAYFRDQDVAEPYDSQVSRIYHELSVLNEEHLSVRNFPQELDPREFARLFREVSEYYPQRLRRVKDLFTRAQRRLEELLPGFREDPIVLRSLFLFREELWPDNPRAGLLRFLEKMFREKGPAFGLLEIARSFLRAGFFDRAVECARLGVAAASGKAQARTTRAQQARETISELDKLIARAEAERKALEERVG